MRHVSDETPPRADTAGEVDELEGDVDAEPGDVSLTSLDAGDNTGTTPDDAAGASGDPGAGPG